MNIHELGRRTLAEHVGPPFAQPARAHVPWSKNEHFPEWLGHAHVFFFLPINPEHCSAP